MAVFFAFRPDVHADNDPFLCPSFLTYLKDLLVH